MPTNTHLASNIRRKGKLPITCTQSYPKNTNHNYSN